MSYAIMRCKKIKTLGSFGGAMKHAFRTRETPNADPALKRSNQFYSDYAATSRKAMKALKDMLPEKIRKNGVIAVEYVFTASPDFFKNADDDVKEDFFNSSLNWLENKYGKDNVITAVIHNDETTPHLSAFVCPRINGKLNARGYIGGAAKLREDQTTFAAAVQHLGLQRGIEGSKAKHQDIKTFYSRLNEPVSDLRVSATDITARKIGMFGRESSELVAKRVSEQVRKQAEVLHAHAIESEANAVKVQNLNRVLAEYKKQKDEAEKKRKKAAEKAEAAKTALKDARDEAQLWQEVAGRVCEKYGLDFDAEVDDFIEANTASENRKDGQSASQMYRDTSESENDAPMPKREHGRGYHR